MKWVLYVLTLPVALGGYLAVLLLMALGFARRPRFIDTAVLTAEWRPWVDKRWRYSTDLTRAVVFKPAHRDRPEMLLHELTHVRQSEDLCFLALLVGLGVAIGTGNWWAGLGIWAASPLWLLPNYLTSWMRGGRIYLDAEHERAAYAIDAQADA